MSRVLVVAVNGTNYGLPVQNVIEVLDDVTITPVPGVAESVRGVVRYQRGVVAVVPLSRIVGGDAPRGITNATVVVVKSSNATIAIEVSDVLEVIDASHERWAVDTVEYDGGRVQLVDVASVAAQLEGTEAPTA